MCDTALFYSCVFLCCCFAPLFCVCPTPSQSFLMRAPRLHATRPRFFVVPVPELRQNTSRKPSPPLLEYRKTPPRCHPSDDCSGRAPNIRYPPLFHDPSAPPPPPPCKLAQNVGLRLSIIRLVLSACQTYGVEAARPLFGADGSCGRSGGDGGLSSSGGRRAEAAGGGGGWGGAGEEEGEEHEVIPALVNFVHLELADWERRRYSEVKVLIRGFRQIRVPRFLWLESCVYVRVRAAIP